ncbi:DUF2059 domain-containing protein [Chryseobacterium herbae]|uniref:DUF2059 domain-containing protein n=1 Tax=Chryseobacterium herbae TaxID=2976476 RepID=A0ABT2IRK0_9FLAO|nr:DUF2059 domain-containing protein [Chryseobacterium sp. pc1-10]MCT2561449.1 DUF2059 domain-containing protein [Chryseobacterium sp. pc1-10]
MKKIITFLSMLVGTLAFSQASEAKIREFIKITGADKMAITVMQQYIQQFKVGYPDVPDRFWDEFSSEISSNKMADLYIPIYAKYYTESDIDELITFYKSPVGQKTLRVMPSLMKESMEEGGKMGREIAQKIKDKLDKESVYQEVLSPPPAKSEKQK